MADDELCFSSTKNNNNKKKNPPLIPTVFLYDLPFICSFIFSQPLYFSYFLFFSPYLIKFIFLFSPLFFTTTLLLLLSFLATTFPHSNKLGFIQTVLDKLKPKLKDVDEEEEDDDDGQEFCDFEDFEIYKIVFHDIIGDGDQMEQVLSVMEDSVEVAGKKSEEETSLERLFEELDRFEDSVAKIEMKETEMSSDLVKVVGELQKPEAVEMEIGKLAGKSMAVTVAVTAEMKISGENQKTVQNSTDTTISGEDQKTVSNSTTISGENHKTIPNSIFFSGEDQKTVPNSTTISGENHKTIPNSKTISGEDQKTVPNSTMISGENQKTVPNSKTISGEVQKAVPYSTTISGEVQKVVPYSTTISGENQKTIPDSKTVSGEDLKTVPNSTTISGEDQKTVPNPFSVKSNSWRLDSCSSFGSYGSMRKEKEWKRTLACKLFEERHNSEGGEEGMDSLWEAYETDHSITTKSKNKKDAAMVKQKKSSIKNKPEFKYFDDLDEDDDDEDEFMMSNGQLCCLKALKLSAGKMNLGMGKPNLVKISKALKGFGWLHHVGSKNGKRS